MLAWPAYICWRKKRIELSWKEKEGNGMLECDFSLLCLTWSDATFSRAVTWAVAVLTRAAIWEERASNSCPRFSSLAPRLSRSSLQNAAWRSGGTGEEREKKVGRGGRRGQDNFCSNEVSVYPYAEKVCEYLRYIQIFVETLTNKSHFKHTCNAAKQNLLGLCIRYVEGCV